MGLGDTRDEREPKAKRRVPSAGTMLTAVERIKDAREVLLLKAGALIFHAKDDLA
jgi:hypothetical protein